ncbi:MAG: zeta toxin family protein [Desulfobacterales bacterium]|nr:zeta toxin family protein [Desulfobacterales bacterium]
MNILKPVLIIIAGPNGSGKTSVTSKILQHEWIASCIYINPDNIARDEFGDWNSPDAVMRAAKKAAYLREQGLVQGQSILFETVLSAQDKLEYIHRAKLAGYFIRLFFVGTDHPAINASRIAYRVFEGGHDVPISKIINRYGKSIANCCIAVRIVDRAYIYDNSVDYAEPKLLFRVTQGKIEKVYTEVNPWAKTILESLQ